MVKDSDQIIINRKNVEALAVSLKDKQKRIERLETDNQDLRRMVTNLTTDVNNLRSQLNIQKAGGQTVVGPTSI